jgi:hypothetical protein
MLESDDDLVDTIKEMQEARGRGDKFNPRQLHEKIEVIGPAINLERLTQSIDVEVLERLGVSWDKWFGLLQVFKEREGHCRVEKTLEVNGLKLGSWVHEQRQNKDRLSLDRIKRLDSIGFSWDPLTEQWEAALNELKEFRKREGHCRVSQKIFINGIALGSWVNTQRIYKEQLDPDRVRRLDALGFSWDPRLDQWEEAFSALQVFRKREGHCRVTGKTVVNGVQLGTWVLVQRQNKSRLTSARLKRLNTLGFSWDPFDEQWERAFLALLSFKRKEGHCLVPRSNVHEGIKLGTWTFVQRQTKKRLTPDRVKRLDSIGFRWDPINDQWWKFFNLLKKFHAREGHCNVEGSFVLDGARLGAWVFTQRQNRDKRSTEQIKLLNSLGFVWDPLLEQWEESFRALQKFKAREGHCLVVRKFKDGKHKLGVWVGTQRQNKRRLSQERIQRLDSLGFSWDPLTDQWEEAFKALKKFHSQEGHCRVSRSYEVGTIQLGNWVMTQRKKRSQLSTDQIKRLESIDFNWDPRDEQWEQGFNALQRYHKRTGHSRVEADLEVDGFKLGNWVVTQRSRKDILPTERLRRLNSLGFSWDPRSEQWEEGFSALQQFHKLHGHCRVSKDGSETSARLCTWITTQRTYKKKLSPSQRKRLESIGFSWDPRSEKWEEAFELLVKFHKREGHSTVPFGYSVHGFNLGSWVSHLRKVKEKLTADRINRLEALDFSWDPRADQWEEGFEALRRFQKRHGHCSVVQSLIEDGFKLGKWVNVQRVRRSELAPIKVKRLDSIGFIWKA